MTEQKSWCLYIIETHRETFYTGITNDLENRWQAHLLGKGSKYLRANKPQAIVYTEVHKDRSSASIREAQVKALSREEKLKLILDK